MGLGHAQRTTSLRSTLDSIISFTIHHNLFAFQDCSFHFFNIHDFLSFAGSSSHSFICPLLCWPLQVSLTYLWGQLLENGRETTSSGTQRRTSKRKPAGPSLSQPTRPILPLGWRHDGLPAMFTPKALSTFLLALFFASFTIAQNDNNFPALSSSSLPSKTSKESSSQASQTPSPSESVTVSAAATTAAATLPPLSSSTASQSYDGIISAPQLSGHYSYPAASVPPTANAPFMQKSTLPQGTVFICVGVALGFLFIVVLAWRGLVAYSIRRSIKKAKNPYPKLTKKFKFGSEGKGMLAKASAPFYSSGPGSTLSLDPLHSSGKGSYKPVHNTGSLFFSPTAGAGVHSGTNRSSGYLPAGYYAAGASEVGGGGAGNSRPISMADFTGSRPQSQGYQRAFSAAPSPNISPMLNPTNPQEVPYGRLNAAGTSTASLGARSEGRAPSAYLDDLFDYPPLPERGEGERRF